MGIVGWLFAAAAWGQTPETEPVPLVEVAAGYEGGSYFRWAAVLGSEVESVKLLIQPTDGSSASVGQLAAGRVGLALAQSDVAWHAWTGSGRVPSNPDIVAIGQIKPELVHLIVRSDSAITSLDDLVGKSVDVGRAGSGTVLNALDVLAAGGIDDDVSHDFTGAFAIMRVQRGLVDAAFTTTLAPWEDLLDAEDVRVVPIEVDALSSAPYYESVAFPEAYGEGSTVQVRALMVADQGLDAAVVQALLDTDRFTVDGISVPLHPAAAAWFTERGASLPEPATGYEPPPLPLLPPVADLGDTEEEARQRFMTAEEVVGAALEANPAVKLALLSRYRADLAVSSSGQAFVPWLGLGTAAGQASDGSGSWNDTLSLGIDAPTGTTLDVTLDATSTALAPGAEWVGLAELAVSHALFDGGGLDANLASLRRAKVDARIADVNVEDAAIDLITDVTKTYYAVAEGYARVAVRENQVDFAKRLLNRVRAQAELGHEDMLAVEEALHAQRSAEGDLLGDRRTLEDGGDTLLDYLQARFAYQVVPLGDVEALATQSLRDDDTLQKRLVAAVMRRPDILLDGLELERSRIDVAEARNGALPSVGLNGGVGRAGSTQNRLFGAVTDAVGAGEPYWDAGVTVDLPLGRGSDPIEHERARIAVKQKEMELEDTVERVMREVRAAWRAAATARQQLEVSKDAASIADRKLTLAIEDFRRGKGTSFVVVNYQEDFRDSRLDVLAAAVDYLQALAELDRVSGTSVDAYRAAFDAVEGPVP